jgi:hypothetical protein
MSASSGLTSYRLQFDISPIVLTGGVATNIAGGALPLINISQALSFPGGLLQSGSDVASLDDFMLHFQPLPGSTLIDQQIGMYPFANQAVAANAVIQQPLAISMLMICPAGSGGGYATKQSTINSLQATFAQHNQAEGLYTILTNAFTYTDCIMLNMTDVSTGQTKQTQNMYKIDFLKPLVSQAAAAQAFNALMGNISANLPSGSTQFGAGNLVGSTVGAQAPAIIPSAGQGALTVPAGFGQAGIGSA